MRIEIVFAAAPAAGDAVLLESGQTPPNAAYIVTFSSGADMPGHIAGCACCTPRHEAAMALSAMFRARATGEAPWFSRVAVHATPDGEAAIRRAIREDVFVAARYRPA